MSRLTKLVAVLKRDAGRGLRGDVYARLVSQLFKPRVSIIASSALSIALVGGLAAWRAGDVFLAAMVGLTSAINLTMIPLVNSFWRQPGPVDVIDALGWERRFALLAFATTAGIGALCARALANSDDAVVHLLVIALLLGGASTTIRSYFRPRIVISQLAILIGPAALAMILRGDHLYVALAIGGIGFGRTLFEIVLGLYRQTVDAFNADEERRIENLRFDAALNNMVHGLCMFDGEGRLVLCNDRFLQMHGLPADVVKPGISLDQLLEHSVAVGNHPGKTARDLYEAIVTRLVDGERSYHTVLGNGRTVTVSYEPMTGGGWVAIYEDVTQRRAAEARIAHMARHDALTSLPNRVLFQERLEQALEERRDDEQVAVLCLDLDRFKSVNDTLGHPIGDGLLKAVTTRLGHCLGDGDLAARLGGDEFAIVQRGVEQPVGATTLAERLVAVIAEPYEIDGHQIVIGTSVGIAIAPGDGAEPGQLLKNADLALYRAKSDGRGRHRFFSADLDERMQARRELELDLRRALAQGEFELVYQPLVTIETGDITGFEALLRWQHPTKGMIPPAEFIPLAEEIGLIVGIGDWVLHHACREAAQWAGDTRIAVNLSPVQFQSGNLVNTVVMALASSGLPPQRLELEITEGVLLHDTAATVQMLHALRDLGVRISMDDFGTGYSSLSYLRSFPFDKIKIDQSFIRDLASRDEALAIVRAVTGLGSSLGIATTAEGVETEEQLAQLRSEGCSEVQGYLLGRPAAAGEAARLLAAQAKAQLAAA